SEMRSSRLAEGMKITAKDKVSLLNRSIQVIPSADLPRATQILFIIFTILLDFRGLFPKPQMNLILQTLNKGFPRFNPGGLSRDWFTLHSNYPHPLVAN